MGDNLAKSIGFDGVGLGEDRVGNDVSDRNAPTIMNVAFTGIGRGAGDIPDNFVSGGYFWDLRADSLEQQALMPIINKVEMRGQDDSMTDEEYLETILDKINIIDEYLVLFDDAFPSYDPNTGQNIELFTPVNLGKALATYQRKIITPNTRFDHFLDGDTSALSSREITGLNKFINAGCVRCR